MDSTKELTIVVVLELIMGLMGGASFMHGLGAFPFTSWVVSEMTLGLMGFALLALGKNAANSAARNNQ